MKNETKGAPPGHYFTKSGNLVKGRLTKDARERGARKSDPKDKQRSKIPPVTQYNPEETKTAPAGHYYTKSGNLVKGRLTKDARERGARKSDPKDKMRSKTPPVTQYNPDEATDGTVSTTDAREAEKLAKKGINVKLTDEMTEQENVEYSDLEIKTIAAEVGKALNSALEQLGEEVTGMKVKGIEGTPKGGGFELAVDYKDNPDGDEFSFYISGSELHLTDFTFDKVIGEVGTLPSGKPLINRDIIKNNLVKHFRSMNLEEKKGKDHDGDGDIDSDDYLAARDKAIKKAMKTEMQDDSARDKNGKMLFIGDIISVMGLMYQARICPRTGKVRLYQVEDLKGTDHSSKASIGSESPLFRKVLMSSEKVASFGRLGLAEDLDIGHQDDEPDMLKQYAYDIAVYASKLYKQLHEYDKVPMEVDFPNWWQAKIIKARDYISKAQHYLEFEENQPKLDAMVDKMAMEGQVNERSSILDDIIHDIRAHGEETGDIQGTAAEYIFNIANAFDINLRNIKDYLFEEEVIERKLEVPSELLDNIYDIIKKFAKNSSHAGQEYVNFRKRGLQGFSDDMFGNLKKDVQFRNLIRNYIKEIKLSYGTDYDDPHDDKHSEDAKHAEGERLYKAGYDLYRDGIKANDQDMIDDAEEMRAQALHLASDFDEEDLPPYSMLEKKGPEGLDKIYDVILKYVKDPDEAMEELDNFISQGKDGFSDELYANLSRDPEFVLALKETVEVMIEKKKLNENKATCCYRCGRKHVKGTTCKRPFLKKSNGRHCANK